LSRSSVSLSTMAVLHSIIRHGSAVWVPQASLG
jgi:hypothetical protein